MITSEEGNNDGEEQNNNWLSIQIADVSGLAGCLL